MTAKELMAEAAERLERFGDDTSYVTPEQMRVLLVAGATAKPSSRQVGCGSFCKTARFGDFVFVSTAEDPSAWGETRRRT